MSYFPRLLSHCLLVLTVLAVVACSDTPEQSPENTTELAAGERQGPLLEGMGDHHHAITTDSAEAQTFFDQGLVLAYGFNHLEAERSFREAARLDPECAMCYWGIAFVRGPNINSMMDPENVPVAWEAMQ